MDFAEIFVTLALFGTRFSVRFEVYALEISFEMVNLTKMLAVRGLQEIKMLMARY